GADVMGSAGGEGRIWVGEAMTATNATAGTNTVTFGIPLADANHLYYQADAVAGTLSSVPATSLADLSTPSSPTIANYDADYPAGTARSWYRILVASQLPIVTNPIILDATSQP